MTGMSLSAAILIGIAAIIALKITLTFIARLFLRALGVVLGILVALIAAPFVLTKDALTARRHKRVPTALTPAAGGTNVPLT